MSYISGESPQFNASPPLSTPSEEHTIFDVAGLKANDLNALSLSQVAIRVLKDGVDNAKGHEASENFRGRLESLEKLERKLSLSQTHYAKESAGLKGFFKGLGHFFRGTLQTRQAEYDNLVQFRNEVSGLITYIKAIQPLIKKKEGDNEVSSLKGRANLLEIPENDEESNLALNFSGSRSPTGVADLVTPRQIDDIFNQVILDNQEDSLPPTAIDSSKIEESQVQGFSFSFLGSAWSDLTSRIADASETVIGAYQYIFDHDALLDEYAGNRAELSEAPSSSSRVSQGGAKEDPSPVGIGNEEKAKALRSNSSVIAASKINRDAVSSIDSKELAGKAPSDFYPLMKNQDLAGLTEIRGMIKQKQQEIRDEQSLLEKGDLYFDKSKMKGELLEELKVLGDKLALLSSGESVVEMEIAIDGNPVTIPLFSDEAIKEYNAKLKELGNSKLEKGLSISLVSSLLSARLNEIKREVENVEKEVDALVQNEKVNDLIQKKDQGEIRQELLTCQETLGQWVSLEVSCNNKIKNLKNAFASIEKERSLKDSSGRKVSDEEIAQVIPEWGALQKLREKADKKILLGLRSPGRQFIDILSLKPSSPEQLKEMRADVAPNVKVEKKEGEVLAPPPPKISSLFGQIKEGVALRKRETPDDGEVGSLTMGEISPPRPAMGGLLGAIQSGKNLKKTSTLPSGGVDSAPVEESSSAGQKRELGLVFKPRREAPKEEARPAVILKGEPAVSSSWQINDKKIGEKSPETLKAEREEIAVYRQELEKVLAPIVLLYEAFLQKEEAWAEGVSKSRKLEEEIASLKEKQKLLESALDVVWMEVPISDKEKAPIALFSDRKFNEYNHQLREMGSKLLSSGMRQSALLDIIYEEIDLLETDKETEDRDIERLEREIQETKGSGQSGMPFNSELYKQIIEDKTGLLDKWGRALKNYDRQLAKGASRAPPTPSSEEVGALKQELRNIDGFDQLDAIKKLREEVAKDKTAPLNLARPGAEWFRRLKPKS